MQEDKECTFDAIDTANGCLSLMAGMLASCKFRKDRMAASALGGYANATDAADYLVGKGIPFREAHGIVGRLVLMCIERGIRLDELPIGDWKSLSEAFDEDIYEAISLKACVERRMTKGAPGAMAEEIRLAEAWLAGAQ